MAIGEFVPNFVEGATISWRSVQTISGDNDVNNQGVLVKALNLGGWATTINGVTFAQFTPVAATTVTSGATAGDITISSVSHLWNGSAAAVFGGTTPPFAGLSTSYQNLLNTCLFNDETSTTYSIQGLSIGKAYLLQLWINDSRNIASVWTRTNNFSAVNSSGAVGYNFQHASGGVGQYVIGTFVADSTTQTISVSGNSNSQVNAYQLRLYHPTLPALNWQQRSDWINVKTDPAVSPHAVGDGSNDDTSAIQAALNIASNTLQPKAVYLPSGTYKITDTLHLSQSQGGLIIGDGANTTIRWSGVQNGRMFWSDGAPYCRYVGINWDGNNIADVGIEHSSSQVSLSLQNFSFEQPALSDGTSTDGSQTVAGWIQGDTSATSHNGIQNPQAAQFANATGNTGQSGYLPQPADGYQYAYVSGTSGSLSHLFNEKWSTGQKYSFSVMVGWPSDESSPGTIVLELRAGSTGGTLVTSGTAATSSVAPAKGGFGSFAVTYTPTATDSFLGQPIYITVREAIGGARIIFDRVQVGQISTTNHYFETRVRHQNEQFANFLAAGIRVGNYQSIASAEMFYDNCLFYSNLRGVSIQAYNDYDNTFDGCEFQDSGVGIYCYYGNAYIRNCHFERSLSYDIMLGPEAHSVRRCTSQDAGTFLGVSGGSSDAPVMVQDCRVNRWKGTGNIQYFGPSPCAIALNSRGPTTIFDTSFTNPPNSNAPILVGSNVIQPIVLSSNSSPGTSSMISNVWPNSYTLYNVPSGTVGPSAITAATSFFRQTAHVPGSIIDVTQSPYNVVKGSSAAASANTTAINSAISAAKATGANCLVYFPVGTYYVNSELNVTGTGSNYSIGGSGFSSVIQYTGSGSNVFHLKDPNNISMEHLTVLSPDNTCRILQESTAGTASNAIYDGIYMSGYDTSLNRKGLEIDDLPSNATVIMPQLNGDAKFVNCSAGTILANVWYDGVMQLTSNQATARTGFVGAGTRVAVGNSTYATVITGNDSLIVGDYYTESNSNFLSLAGVGVTGVSGKVTIHAVKTGINDGTYPATTDVVTFDHYYGKVSIFGARFRYQDPTIFTTGAAPDPLTLVLAGNSFWYDSGSPVQGPLLNNFSQALTTTVIIQNCIINSSDHNLVVTDQVPSGADAILSGAMDDFRRLGAEDLSLNHP